MTGDDQSEIQRVFSSYSLAVDRAEWHRLPEVFTETARWILADGSEFIGLPTIRERMRAGYELSPSGRLHQPFNICLNVDGDVATADSNWIYYGAQDGSPWGIVSYGDYADEFQRTSSGWRLSVRRIIRHLEY